MYNKIDYNFYLKYHKDLHDVFGDNIDAAKQHYKNNGIVENRVLYNTQICDFYNALKLNNTKPYILIITHNLGGGTQTFLDRLIKLLINHYNIIIQTRIKDDDRMVYKFVFKNYEHYYYGDLDMKKLCISLIIVNHCITFGYDYVHKYVNSLHIPYIIILHDYYLISNNYTLHDDYIRTYEEMIKIKSFLVNSKVNIVPSCTAGGIIFSYYKTEYKYIQHQILNKVETINIKYKNKIKIAFVGTINEIKGLSLLLDIDNNYEEWGNFEFYVIGTSCHDFKNIKTTGYYDGDDGFYKYVKELNVDMFCIPSIVEETYNYVLDMCLTTCKPILLPNRIIFQERTFNINGIIYYPIKYNGLQLLNFIKNTKLPDSSDKFEIIHKINPIYVDVINSYHDHLIPSDKKLIKLGKKIFNWSGLKQFNTECMNNGIFTEYDLLTKYTPNIPQSTYHFYRGHSSVVDTIYDILCKECYELRINNQLIINNSNNTKAAVIIEPRKHPMLEPIIRNIMNGLDKSWNLYVFTSLDTFDYIKDRFKDSEFNIIDIKTNNLNAMTYSNLMMTTDFWNNMHEENILVFQTDSFIVNKNAININNYLKYSYVGARHEGCFHNISLNTPNCIGLNGGFSLRKRLTMLKIINTISTDDINKYRSDKNLPEFNFIQDNHKFIPEDAYFYHGVEILGYDFPTDDECDKFCVQDYVYKLPFALHSFYHGNMSYKDVKQVLDLV